MPFSLAQYRARLCAWRRDEVEGRWTRVVQEEKADTTHRGQQSGAEVSARCYSRRQQQKEGEAAGEKGGGGGVGGGGLTPLQMHVTWFAQLQDWICRN